MFKIVVIGIALITGVFGVLSLSQAPQQTPEIAVANIAATGQLIDVRTAAEFADGHIDGSINLSLQEIEQGALPSSEKNQPLYVYCRSGNRSAEAATLLRAAGFSQVNDLGAIANVEALGGIVVR